MHAARLMVALASVAVAMAGCNKNPSQDQNIAISNVPAGADVEALPPDESSTTPSNELINGADNADVNSATNSSE